MSDACRIKRNYAGVMIALGRASTIDQAEGLAIAQIEKEEGESFDEYAKRSLSILGIDDLPEDVTIVPSTPFNK